MRENWKLPTLRDCLDGAVANAKAAEQLLAAAKRRYDELPPGHVDLPALRLGISRHRADLMQWRDYEKHFRERCLAEGEQVVPRALMRGDFTFETNHREAA